MFGTLAFCCILATLIAGLEVEAEGKYGWAEKMPTWYRTTGPIARLYGLIMGGKPLTGYHSYMFVLPFVIFHAHFALGVTWTFPGELKAWAMYLAFCPMWDYLWFVLNPWYHRKFNKSDVWWHAKSPWIAGFPLDYYMGFGLSIALAATASWWSDDWTVFQQHYQLLIGFLGYTLMVGLWAPMYHQWYWYMRRPGSDERHLAGSFHTSPPTDVPEEMKNPE
jgi:hypothetical protein